MGGKQSTSLGCHLMTSRVCGADDLNKVHPSSTNRKDEEDTNTELSSDGEVEILSRSIQLQEEKENKNKRPSRKNLMTSHVRGADDSKSIHTSCINVVDGDKDRDVGRSSYFETWHLDKEKGKQKRREKCSPRCVSFKRNKLERKKGVI
ncbi:uncharacterized protein LOC127879970 [Dreissena polymorpha]|uniref:uncharacterized protein LOC127879970 n=1 Tax=Dreissena polymorpha TaxID=45954 RepID=UPI00226465F3|nr:uncharacterized protein LOC127879970 [Dreissena polymorpha]